MTTQVTVPTWAEKNIKELNQEHLSVAFTFIDSGDSGDDTVVCLVQENCREFQMEGIPLPDMGAIHLLRRYGESIVFAFPTYADARAAYHALCTSYQCSLAYTGQIEDSQIHRGFDINAIEEFIHHDGEELEQARNRALDHPGDAAAHQALANASVKWGSEQEGWLKLVWGMSEAKAHATMLAFVTLNERFKQWEQQRLSGQPPSILSVYNRE